MNQITGKILVVDDEENMCEVLKLILQREGHEVNIATQGNLAIETFRNTPFDIVIQDIKMGDTNGLTLIKEYKEIDPSIIIIVITAFSTFEIAVEAMRQGCYDYIKKPFSDNRTVKSTIRRALQFRKALNTLPAQRPAKTEPASKDKTAHFRIIIGSTPQMKEVYNLIQRVAMTNSTILIQGESGTGKELVARAIHYSSSRVNEPFITVACGTFPETLLESELFGHLKGSFTSAVADKKGLLEVADKGTFFLDEVGEISPQMQVKLLRMLEEKEFKPIGGTETKQVDVRFVTATNADLESRIKAGTFRKDLFYRLNVIIIQLPPLRERKDDIPLLAGHFLAKYTRATNKPVSSFRPEVLELMINYDWPGNVRELENTIHRAVVLTEDSVIKPQDLTPKVRDRWAVTPEPAREELLTPEQGAPLVGLHHGVDLEKKVRTLEEDYIREAIKAAKGRLSKAARLLNLDSRALRYKMKKYNINPSGDHR